MAQALTDAHHQWIRDVSGGLFDPPRSAAATNAASALNANTGLEARKNKIKPLADKWRAAEQKIFDDADALYDELAAHFDGDEHASLMEQDFEGHLSRMFDTFDGSLAKDLAAVAAAGSDAEFDKATADIRAMIRKLTQFIQNDDAMKMLDQNPFIHLDTSSFCIAKIEEMQKALG